MQNHPSNQQYTAESKQVALTETCPACNGTGCAILTLGTKCDECWGSGKVTVFRTVPDATPTEKGRETTTRRGETLEQDGYSFHAYADQPGVYECRQPEDKKLAKGSKSSYEVDVVNQTCDCEAFRQHGVCKHLRGLNRAVARSFNLLAPMISAPQPAAAVYGRSRGFENREAFERARELDFA